MFVCIPTCQKFVEILIPKAMDKEVGLWEVIIIGISSLIKELREPYHPFCHVRTQQRDGYL